MLKGWCRRCRFEFCYVLELLRYGMVVTECLWTVDADDRAALASRASVGWFIILMCIIILLLVILILACIIQRRRGQTYPGGSSPVYRWLAKAGYAMLADVCPSVRLSSVLWSYLEN